jgi:hypothetical protein
VKPNACSTARLLTLCLLSAAVSACSSAPSASPQLVPLQPLSPQAEQPALPAWCSPTCSAGLTRLRESWQQLLTEPMPQDSPASASTGHP